LGIFITKDKFRATTLSKGTMQACIDIAWSYILFSTRVCTYFLLMAYL
jgi:hypothetical protein